MQNVIETKSLWKHYDGFALKDLSLSIPAGYITGLIGPNGSGKTTFIKLLMNLIREDDGSISVFGMDHREQEIAIKDRIGFVYDMHHFCEDHSLQMIKASIAPFYSRWDDDEFWRLMDSFWLSGDRKFKTLSLGMKAQFSLCLALSHHADLLLLDEPTTGLDPIFRRQFLEMLGRIIQDENKSVLFSTHITSDLDKIADHIVFLLNGELVLCESKDTLHEEWGIIKARENFVSARSRELFKGMKSTSLGFSALTHNLAAARIFLPADAVIEKPSIEDIMFYLADGGSHG